MSTTCKYCNGPEDKQNKPGLICESCMCFVHLVCLKRTGTPGDFSCDVFFDFTCEDCSDTKKEIFIRNKFPWVNVILLTLHHLSIKSYGISNHGFFHYKTHICSFIDRNWNLLFGSQFKQKKNWVGTIAGALSVYSNLFFRSGSAVLGETGWWRLLHDFSPAVAAHIAQEMARDKPKGRPRNQMSMDTTHFIEKVTELGYKEFLNENKDSVPVPIADVIPTKRRRVDWEVDNSNTYNETTDTDRDERTEMSEEISYDTSEATYVSKDYFSDTENVFAGFSYTSASHLAQSDSSSVHSFKQSILNYDSDTRSVPSPSHTSHQSDLDDKLQQEAKKNDMKIKKLEDKVIIKRESLFSSELNSQDMPWDEKLPEPKSDLVKMTQYEEIQLLKQVENLIPKVKDISKRTYLCRLKAKLALRRLKRHKHLPIFDLDETVKLLGGYVTEDAKVSIHTERVLDRFQRSYLLDNLCGTISSANPGVTLVSVGDLSPFRSAYSGVTLKPYIRRDTSSRPLWLKLMDELLKKTNRHIKDYEPPPASSIDFSYVRPHHIAAVNNLCAQFFWPGVDLTESLQYPEFSCVVTYKRLVIGCAFLVPDVGPHECYISFVLVRPEWRHAKIGAFMLYHLLQTCTGKDVTLHVSPTNPAIFLYQKFGFKVEELIQDFYEKYYDIDYKGCRHALYLRLVR